MAWLTRHAAGVWHEWFGYGVLLIVLLRSVAGFTLGVPWAFNSFVVGPLQTLAYLRSLRSNQGFAHSGHNPLGAWMVVTLLSLLWVVCVSGWLYTTDQFWGVEWVGDLHAATSDLLLLCIALHVCGVLFTSWHERRNLIAAMLPGRKTAGIRTR